ncbi:MAG: hypothetical protein ABL928_03085 [Sphingorhabdus sp.]
MTSPERNGHEESLFYTDETGRDALVKVIVEISKEVCKAKGLPIRIDEFLCEEAHARAQETIGFHKTKEYSIYKEVAHVGFWLNRLKPIRIDSPMNTFRALSAARTALDEWTHGNWVKLEKKAQTEEQRLSGDLDFPVNEHVVVSFLLELIEAGQTAHANTLGGTLAADYNQAIADNRKRNAWLRSKIEKSLRDHNYSARGFATMVEATFRTRCEQD